jgi:hypothetical protein
MNRKVLNSSRIGSVGYDPAGQILEVEMNDGTIYQYYNVGMDIYADLLDAPSKEHFFDSKIKNVFQFAKV